MENMSESEAYIAKVDEGLRDLIPGYLANRHKELSALEAAAGAQKFDEVRKLAHKMKGVGASYGFDRITQLGRELEEAAKIADEEGIRVRLKLYSDYLEHVQIRFA